MSTQVLQDLEIALAFLVDLDVIISNQIQQVADVTFYKMEGFNLVGQGGIAIAGATCLAWI